MPGHDASTAGRRMRPPLATRVKPPPLEPLIYMLGRWNPDDPDGAPVPFYEQVTHSRFPVCQCLTAFVVCLQLQVFDYQNKDELAMALEYRNAEIPFKVFNVPELAMVGDKWTDEYLTKRVS